MYLLGSSKECSVRICHMKVNIFVTVMVAFDILGCFSGFPVYS